MVYKIYKITNIINDKMYVGFTSQTIEKRFNQHKSKSKSDNLDKLHKAIKKYGVDNFKIELISEHQTMNDALDNEKKLISELDLTKNGYNLSSGGEWSPNEKIKLRGRTFTEEHRGNISKNHADIRGDKNPMFGKKHSLESRQKISNKLKGKSKSTEARENMSKAALNRSTEHKLKIGATKKGKPRSEETKRKISESLKKRALEL